MQASSRLRASGMVALSRMSKGEINSPENAMRTRIATVVALLLGIAACDRVPTDPATTHSPQSRTASASSGPTYDVASNGPSNQCYGAVLSGIASTWPWAHDGRMDFEPPPGAIALWIKLFGPAVGVTSVRELQFHFCST